MNARTSIAGLAAQLPRPGRVALVVVRLAAVVVAAAFGIRALWAVLDPSGFVGAALSLLVAPVMILAIVITLLAASGALTGSKGDSAAAKTIASVAEKVMEGSGQAAAGLFSRLGPGAGRLALAAVGGLILLVFLGGYPSERPNNTILGWAHDRVRAAFHPAFRGAGGSSTGESGPDRKAIEQAISEGAPELASRWKFAKWTQSFTQDVYEYRAKEADHADFALMGKAWIALAPTMAYRVRVDGIKCEARVRPAPHFLAIVPRDAVAFPGLPDTALAPFIDAHRAELLHYPRRFCIGLDEHSEPVWADFGETAHFLVAGTNNSGKSRSGLFSPLAQLLVSNTPAQLRLWLLDSVKREVTKIFGDAPHIERAKVAEDGEAVLGVVRAFVEAMGVRFRDLGGREWTPSIGPWNLLVIEEWADLNDLLDREQREEFVRLVNRVGQIGRAGAFNIILLTQKAHAAVLDPRLKTNLAGRISGYFANSQDYGIVLDTQKVSLPRVKGRLAVKSEEGITICQGLFGDNDTIRRLISAPRPKEESRRDSPPPRPAHPDFTSRGPTRPEPQPARPASDPDAITQRLASEMSPRTAARILRNNADQTRSFGAITRDTFREMVAALGLIAPNNEKLGAALSALKGAGVLEAKGRSHTLKDRSWAVLSEMLTKAGL
jgi:hypothetical protein